MNQFGVPQVFPESFMCDLKRLDQFAMQKSNENSLKLTSNSFVQRLDELHTGSQYMSREVSDFKEQILLFICWKCKVRIAFFKKKTNLLFIRLKCF